MRRRERAITLASYALSGFANFSSIAIQIDSIGPLAATCRADLVRLGLKSMIAGLLACYLFAVVVGVLLYERVASTILTVPHVWFYQEAQA